jgi:L-threonylcarbamoyladenylate synthase
MAKVTDQLEDVLKVLRSGGVIVYPSDTVWGLGCDATKAVAVERLNKIKGRKGKAGLIVLLPDFATATQYCDLIPEHHLKQEGPHTKPTTWVLPGAKNLAKGVISSTGEVAIRVPGESACLNVVSALKSPLVSTSANLSGFAVPQRYKDLSPELVSLVDLVYYPNDVPELAVPSRIIRLKKGGEIEIIRE